MSGDHEIFELGDFVLQCGATLRGAQLAYKTYGALNPAQRQCRSSIPTAFGRRLCRNEPRIEPGMALDPDKYFIIVPSLFGNGLSSSPSNTPEPFDGPRFPRVTIYDNVVAQHRLVAEEFGVARDQARDRLLNGRHPDLPLGRALSRTRSSASRPSAARRAARGTITSSSTGSRPRLPRTHNGTSGWYNEKPAEGLRAFGRVYAGWAFSQAFYRARARPQDAWAIPRLRTFMVAFWEGFSCPRTRTICSPCCGPGSMATSPPTISIGGDFDEGARAPSRPRPM